MIWYLALCPDEMKQGPVVYGAGLSVVFLVKGPRMASIKEVLGCGSFVRGRKRKKVDSRLFLYYIIEEEEKHTRETSWGFPLHQYERPSIPIIYIPNPFSTWQYRETEYPKQPPYSVRNTISETLHELLGKTAKRQQLQFQQISSNWRSPSLR